MKLETTLENYYWDQLKYILLEETGILLREPQKTINFLKVKRVLDHFKYKDLQKLVQQLSPPRNHTVLQALTECFTIHESSFFRHNNVFDVLRKEILPLLIKDNKNEKKLRIWSAGCASGQEIYSLMMLIETHFPDLDAWNVQSLATDISPACILKAQRGLFHDFEIQRGLSEENRNKYFSKLDNDLWKIDSKIQDRIEFSTLNLAQPFWHSNGFDIIFLRNVLIYFSEDARTNVLQRIIRYLKPDGVLILGPSETGIASFNAITIEGVKFYKRT